MNTREKKYIRHIIEKTRALEPLKEDIGLDKSKVLEINKWISKANSLIWKIKLSFKFSMDYIERCEDANPFDISYENEDMAYYNMENALFRIRKLWEVLSIICSIHCGININLEGNNYKNKEVSYSLRLLLSCIYKYIDEDIEPDDEDTLMLKGNYEYVKDMEDRMNNHWNPNNLSIIQDFKESIKGIEKPENPDIELRRMAEDFNVLYSFLAQEYLNIREGL